MSALAQLAHFLTLILRHEPDRHGLMLDTRGFAPLDAVWRAVEAQFPGVYSQVDIDVLARSKSGRRHFEIIPAPPRIRARCGHSRSVRPVEYEPAVPPETLFYITTPARLGRIRTSGLVPTCRQYVHLTASMAHVQACAARRRDAQPIILSIRAGSAQRAGITFHHVIDDRYLARFVPAQFIDLAGEQLLGEADWLLAAARILPEHLVLVIDRQRLVRAAAGMALRGLGVDAGLMVGQFIDQALPHDYLALIEPLIAAALGGENASFQESTAGQTLLYRSFPLRQMNGFVYAALIHIQDVSAQQRVEDALRESQRFIERVTTAMPDAVYVYDLIERRSIYNNNKIADILGYTPETIEGLGAGLMEWLLHPDDYVRQQAGEERFWRAGDGDIIESLYRMRHADGSWRWVNLRDIIFQRDEQGRPTQILGIAQDVTEHIKAQEAALERERLHAALQKEHELSDLKTRLMQRISHEFRTPLAIIQTSAELLDFYFDRLSEEQRHDQIDRIKQEIAHLAAMLDDVALVIGGSLHRSQPALKPFDLRQDIRQLVMRFSQTVQHPIELQTPGDPVIVLADRTMIHALIRNLLSNAVKFSRRDQPVSVSLSACTDDSNVELIVADRGIGIPEVDLNHITEAFYRGRNVSEINGVGVGLAVVKQVVDVHRGSLTIESAVGVGTRVAIHLPICHDQDDD